jgi:hypothetical protein
MPRNSPNLLKWSGFCYLSRIVYRWSASLAEDAINWEDNYVSDDEVKRINVSFLSLKIELTTCSPKAIYFDSSWSNSMTKTNAKSFIRYTI